MNVKTCFLEKQNKKQFTNLSSAELALRVVKLKMRLSINTNAVLEQKVVSVYC